jgi:hypothetical protein
MTLPERLYRALLWLYPAQHRRAYQEPMLQHARDLSRAAHRQGSWAVAMLYWRLFKDGIANAAVEHLEGNKMAHNRYQPVAWASVLLACIPGLLIALTRRNPAFLEPLWSTLISISMALFLIAIPGSWFSGRRFPVWGLLPAGMLTWFFAFIAGSWFARQVNALHPDVLRYMDSGTGIALVNILLAALIFAAVLRTVHLPGRVLLVFSVFLVGNLAIAVLYSLSIPGNAGLLPGFWQYFTVSDIGPVTGLMLVAVGLLAARKQGVLGMLVVIGGYGFMFLDSDYLLSYPAPEWVGIPAYLALMTVLFLVIVPAGLLRARTRLGRALAVFGPVVAFLVLRRIIPLVMSRQPLELSGGELIFSLNILLSLLLAWALYSHLGTQTSEAQPDSPVSLPDLAS